MVMNCYGIWCRYLVVFWGSKVVPQDWNDALLVPVAKKGDLSFV